MARTPKKPVKRKSTAKKKAVRKPARNKSTTSAKPRKKKTTTKPASRKTTTRRRATTTRKRTVISRRKTPVRSTRQKLESRRRTGSRNKVAMPGWLRVTFSFAYRVSAVCFLGAVIGIISLFYFSRDLPSIRKLETMTRPAQITIVDRHGDLVTRYGQVYGSPVTISELPPHVVQAVLATEDRNFYHHRGVNPVAVLRALVVNIRSGAVRQGGSTITQQLAKNIFLTPERTVKRKVQEMLLSVQLEMAYTKDEILALYLNNVYFGAGTYGLRAAAERYFEKAPSELTVGEAAMLAGLLKAPSRYSPTASPEAARDRARTVLEVMFDAGYLSREKTDTLLSGPIATISQRQKPAPYAADFVMAELREEFGKMQEDVTIHTTIDLKAHERSIASIAALPEKDTRFREDIQVAAIAMEADGAIRLMIGGRSYTESEYNRATHAKRQPGSAFKPFVYMAALEQGWAPNDIILDTPIELNGWTPANYKDKYYGAVKMSEAMARSLNAAAIRLQEETGRPHVLDVARRVGFAGKIDPGAALALGVNETTPLELAKTYAPFANNGYSAEPYVITSIYGKKGNIIYARNPEQPREVMQQDVVIAMNHMLREVVSLGSGRAAQIPGYVTAGKTGTTQDSRDAWFAGHAAGLVGIVWMGKDDYTPMVEGWSPVSGSGTPAILWSEVMQASLNGRPDTPIVPWAPKRPLPSIFDHFRGLLTSDTRAESGPPILYHGAEPRSTIVAEEPVVVAIAEVEEPPVIEVTPIPENPMDRLLAEVMVDETTPMPEVTDLEALLIQARTSQEAAERQAANASGTDEAARPTP